MNRTGELRHHEEDAPWTWESQYNDGKRTEALENNRFLCPKPSTFPECYGVLALTKHTRDSHAGYIEVQVCTLRMLYALHITRVAHIMLARMCAQMSTNEHDRVHAHTARADMHRLELS